MEGADFLTSAVYQAAVSHIKALEEHSVYLRDEAIRIAKERDEWRRAYEDAMRPWWVA